MNHSLAVLSKGVNFALHLVNFMTKFKLRVQEVTKLFSYFCLQLVRMKSGKKPCPRFLITFLLYEILAYITFLFSLKSLLKLLRNRGTVLPSGYFLKCTPLLKELRQVFFQSELEHCTLTENPLRRLIPFHCYYNFNPPTRLNDV